MKKNFFYEHGLLVGCIALVPLLLLVGARIFIWEPYRVPSASMYPGIPQGSFVIADKRGFGHVGILGFEPFHTKSTATISRGDVVVFRLPEDPSIVYLKRVVAIPGDHIEYRDQRMTLNGQPVPLTFNGPGEHAFAGRGDRYQLATETIDGLPITIAFLPQRSSLDYDQNVPPDHFVMFGDNRDNARDSRYIGMIARDAILGKVVKVFSAGAAK